MPEVSEILPARIRERLDTTGKSMRAVSLAIGAHPGYVRDLLDPDRFNIPSSTRLRDLAIALDTTTEFLIGDAETADQVRSEVALAERRDDYRGPDPFVPPIPELGTGDCADLQVCDETGQLVSVERSTFDPDYHVRYVQRPKSLNGATDVYAIRFQGESMLPRFEPGELAIVNPRLQIQRGDYVLVQLRGEGCDDVVSVLAKRFLRQSDADYVLEQFNPPVVFSLPKSRVARMHKIMRQGDYLG